MARLPDLIKFAARHKLKIGTVADLIRYRSETGKLVERVASRVIETRHGAFTLYAYLDRAGNEKPKQ